MKRLCGKIQLPPDGGEQMIRYSLQNSDASLKDGQCSHAWIITTPNPDDIDEPHMSKQGWGMVDGYPRYLSSACGEIQGQTAATTLLNGITRTHNATNISIKLVGNNQGVQNKCHRQAGTKLRSHRDPNSDLFAEYNSVACTLKPKVLWVRSHQDNDTPWDTIEELKELKLSPEATLNVWCDRQAEIACQEDITYPDADILPSEKWALFPTTPDYFKITGSLDEVITATLHYDSLQQFIKKSMALPLRRSKILIHKLIFISQVP
jgi:hypothetical protein